MHFIRKHKCLVAVALVALVAVVCAFFLLAKVSTDAVAGQTQPQSVSVQAQIDTDGSLSVIDQRTFVCSENTTLNWEVSKTTKVSATEVTAVRVIVEGEGDAEIVALEQAEMSEEAREELRESKFEALPENKWFFDGDDSWFYASLSPKFAGKTVVVEVSYVQHDAVYVYDDVAELYWDYVPAVQFSPIPYSLIPNPSSDSSTNPYSLFPSPSSDSSSTNPYSLTPNPSKKITIDATVLIPAGAQNEIVNTKTVWGWGHGFAGTVEFSEVGAYIYKSSAATLNKTSQAHIIFPASCLVNYDKNSATNVGGARQGRAVSEEANWTDEWSVQVVNSALVDVWVCVGAFLVTLMATIAYAGVYCKYKRILGDNVSLKEQLDFDEACLKFQKRMLVVSFTLLLIGLFCLVFLKSFIGCGACVLSFVMCLLQSNWTPSVHRSFRDRIKV